MTTSNADAIRTVAVLGGGTMGNGIAHVFARAGYAVILRDVEQRFLDHALETISTNLDREIKKGAVAAAELHAVLANGATASPGDAKTEAGSSVSAFVCAARSADLAGGGRQRP